ncbi:HLF transcription factor, PAR bZIP family member b isoform 2-T2 [Spinachia spinachia]
MNRQRVTLINSQLAGGRGGGARLGLTSSVLRSHTVSVRLAQPVAHRFTFFSIDRFFIVFIVILLVGPHAMDNTSRHPVPRLAPPGLVPAPAAAHGVLKSLLEKPMKLHHEAFSKEQEKEKNLVEERGAPQSAFLGPTLWDKTLPYDGDSFQLEYMDLEEFLSENGISSGASQQHRPLRPPGTSQAPPTPSPSPSPSVMDLSNQAFTSVVSVHCLQGGRARTGLPGSRRPPSLVDPDSAQVLLGYESDPADRTQEVFDPRKHKFSAEELKPQPMIKKARKVFIPEGLKDDKYWARRRKNNMAAKRSRDARRLKENQIAIRAAFLEKENLALRQEAAELRRELGRTRSAEGQHGALLRNKHNNNNNNNNNSSSSDPPRPPVGDL